METSCFDLMIMPVTVATIEVVAGCWVVSTLARWAGRLFGAAGRSDNARDSRDLGLTEWNSAWSRHHTAA